MRRSGPNWCTSYHRRNRMLDRSTPWGGPQFSRTTLLRGKWAQSIVAKLIALAASAESRRGTLSWMLKRQRPPNVSEALARGRYFGLSEISLVDHAELPSSRPEHQANAYTQRSVPTPVTRVMRVPLFCETDPPFSLRASPWLSTFRSSSLHNGPRNPVLLQPEPGLVFCLVRSW